MIKGSWSCQTKELRWPASLDLLSYDQQISSFQRHPLPRKKSSGAWKDWHNKSEDNPWRKTSRRTLQSSADRQNASHACLHPAPGNPGKKPRSANPSEIPTHFDRSRPPTEKTDAETSGVRKTHRVAETGPFLIQKSYLVEDRCWGDRYF